jgi:hypothetical protein
MALPKCRSCGYELAGTSSSVEGGLFYDWGHEADCLARKLKGAEDKLGSHQRAIGLIRAKAAMWPGVAASADQWFREILDVCDLVKEPPK